MEKSSKIFLWTISLSVLLAIISTGYKFIIKKDYDFLVEAPCDSANSQCYHRDCSNPDDCPPNGLENYRKFLVKARDFSGCNDNYCLSECLSGTIQCEEVVCGDDEADECTDKPAPLEPTSEPSAHELLPDPSATTTPEEILE